jgi:hypothetical protein
MPLPSILSALLLPVMMMFRQILKAHTFIHHWYVLTSLSRECKYTQPECGIQVTSPIAKTPKQKHWRVVHRRCLQGFKEADKEREELTQSIQQLEEDNAQATTKVRQLSDTNDRNLAKIQELEFQISSLKQQLQFAQACCTIGDNLLPILLEVSGNFQYAQNQLEKKIEAEKNKSAFAGLSASDVLQGSSSVHNGQMGSFGTNSLPSYPLPNTLSPSNQQAPIQFSQQPLQQGPVQFSQQPLQQTSQYIAQL